VAEGVVVIVDAIVRPALVPVWFGIPRLTASELDAKSDVEQHRAIDELLDLDAHDCIRGGSECYVCEVRRGQRGGRRV
jgi:hypothetical protein